MWPAILLCFAGFATGAARGESVPGDVAAALQSPQPAERENALDRLANASERWPDSLPLLARLLGDTDPAVAGKAASLLGQMGTSAFPAIRDALASGSAQRRWGATVDEMLERALRIDDESRVSRPGLARSVAAYRALGWSLDVTPEGDIAEHSGSNSSGFKAFGQFNLTKGSGFVIFSNSDGGYPLREAVIDRVGDL